MWPMAKAVFALEVLQTFSARALSKNADPRRFTNPSEAARELSRELDALVRPPDCKTSRLLLRDFPQENVEGLGSVMGMFLNALGEAYYSNRSIVVGPRPPSLFAMDSRAGQPGWCSSGMGVECFLQPLSVCSMVDIHPDEVEDLATRPMAEARVKWSDSSRGNMCVFTPPRKYRKLKNAREWWVRQLAQFVFRLQPWLKSEVASARERLRGLPRPFVGVHVRHGDLQSLRNTGELVYEDSKGLFTYQAYWDAVEKKRPDAKTVVVASDSKSIVEEVERRRAVDPGRTYFLVEEALRTEFGSHMLVLKSTITEYNIDIALDVGDYPVPRDSEERAQTADRLILESVIDIMLLSSCEHLVGTGSSMFSMWANLLRLGPSGEVDADVSAPIWIDEKRLISGQSSVGLLFSNHLEDSVERAKDPGFRWKYVQNSFLDSHATDVQLGTTYARFNRQRGLPWFDFDLFDKELVLFRWHDPDFQVPCELPPGEAINLGVMLQGHDRWARSHACYTKASRELVDVLEPRKNTETLVKVVSQNLQLMSKLCRQDFFFENMHAFGLARDTTAYRGIYQFMPAGLKLITALPVRADSGLTSSLSVASPRHQVLSMVSPPHQVVVIACSSDANESDLLRFRRSSPFAVFNLCSTSEPPRTNAHKFEALLRFMAKTSTSRMPHLLVAVLDVENITFNANVTTSEVHSLYYAAMSRSLVSGGVVYSVSLGSSIRTTVGQKLEGLIGSLSSLRALVASLGQLSRDLSDQAVLSLALKTAAGRNALSVDGNESIFDFMVSRSGETSEASTADKIHKDTTCVIDPGSGACRHHADFLTLASTSTLLPEDCSEAARTFTLRLNWPSAFDKGFNIVTVSALYALWTNRTFHVEPTSEWPFHCAVGIGWQCWFQRTTTCSPPLRAFRTRYRLEDANVSLVVNKSQPFLRSSGSWELDELPEKVVPLDHAIFEEQHVEIDAKTLSLSPLLQNVMYGHDGNRQSIQSRLLPKHKTLEGNITGRENLSILSINRRVNKILWQFQPEVEAEISSIFTEWAVPVEGRLWGIFVSWGKKECDAAIKALEERPTQNRPSAVLVAGGDSLSVARITSACRLGLGPNGKPVPLISLLHSSQEFANNVYKSTLFYLAQIAALRRCEVIIGDIESSPVQLVRLLHEDPVDSGVKANQSNDVEISAKQ